MPNKNGQVNRTLQGEGHIYEQKDQNSNAFVLLRGGE